jgi:hypothetical protein
MPLACAAGDAIMKVSIPKLFVLGLLSLQLNPSAVAADASVEAKKAEVEPMGAFEKMNFMRKMIGPGLDVKKAGEAIEAADKNVKEEFVVEKLDEAKIKIAVDEEKKALGGMVAAMKHLFAVMGEFLTPERIEQMKAAEAEKSKAEAKGLEIKEAEAKEAVQIPASFSAEQITKIRAMKAKNLAPVESIKASVDFEKGDFMSGIMNASTAEKNNLLAKIEDSGSKSIDLDVEEYREMRGYISAAEMKTFFTLQNQVKEKKAKARREKAEALKKIKEDERK